MVYKCCAPNCRGNYDGETKVTIFKFPSDETLKNEWLRKIPREMTVTSSTRICEVHFHSSDIIREEALFDTIAGKYVTVPRRATLRPGAVPSIFPNCPEYLSSYTTTRASPETKKKKREISHVNELHEWSRPCSSSDYDDEVMIKEEAMMAEHDMITGDHNGAMVTPSSSLAPTHQSVNEEADILHDGVPTVIIKDEVMMKEGAIMVDNDMITADHRDAVGTPSSSLAPYHQSVNDEADILHDGVPTVIIKDEVMIKEEAITVDNDMITADHRDALGTPSSSLAPYHQSVNEEADILHDGVPTVIIKDEVMIKEEAITVDNYMITADHRDALGTPSSSLAPNHQSVNEEADILHDGVPTVIIKDEVMIKEETITVDNDMITADHRDAVGTPSSSLAPYHQSVNEEADILHDGVPTVIIKDEVMIKEEAITVDHMITADHRDDHRDAVVTPSSSLAPTHQSVNDEADILHDGVPTVIIKDEVMIKEEAITVDNYMITADHRDALGTPSSSLAPNHQSVNEEADILHDGVPTVIIKDEVMIKEETITVDNDMITADHRDAVGTPSSSLAPYHQSVNEEADILHDGVPTVIIKDEVMIKEEAITVDHMITADHRDDHRDAVVTPSSSLAPTHQSVNDEADILHDGVPTVVIKDEVMVKEEAITVDNYMITADHRDAVGTPSSSLAPYHQSVNEEADILHDGVIIKDEVMIKEGAITVDNYMISADYHDAMGTPSSSLAPNHQPVKDAADILHERNSCIGDVIKKDELVIKEEPVSADDDMGHNALQADLTSTSPCLASQRSHSSAIQDESVSSVRGKYSGKFHVCRSCDYRTGHLSHLKTHIRTHSGEKPYSCDICDFRTGHPNNLKTHMRTHAGEKPHACDVCDYRSGLHIDLKRHMLTHTGEKPHACDMCDYRTGRPSSLKTHVRTHTGEKPYSCDDCDYRTGRLSDLKGHLRTHTGEKPYSCVICDYRTGHLGNLTKHMRKIHKDVEPYSCDICDYRTGHLRHMKRHIWSHRGLALRL